MSSSSYRYQRRRQRHRQSSSCTSTATDAIRRTLFLLGFIYLYAITKLLILTDISTTSSSILILNNNSNNKNGSEGGKERSRGLKKKKKLQEKLDSVYVSTTTKKTGGGGGGSYKGNLWDLSDYCPLWMTHYFNWHQQQKRNLLETLSSTSSLSLVFQNINNINTTTSGDKKVPKLLIMTCYKGIDDKCGGTADRLKHFVFLIRMAYKSGRLLLIDWTLPAKLEEFLVPPLGGIDWTVPIKLHQMILRQDIKGIRFYKGEILHKKITQQPQKPNHHQQQQVLLYQTRLQSVTGFAELYNQQQEEEEEPTFEDVYHDVWRIFFTPSKPVRDIIERNIRVMNIRPGQYTSAHLRALYGRITSRTQHEIWDLTTNAINCAISIYYNSTITTKTTSSSAAVTSEGRGGAVGHHPAAVVFASDLPDCNQVAVQYGQQQQQQQQQLKLSSSLSSRTAITTTATRVVSRTTSTTTTSTNQQQQQKQDKRRPLHLDKAEDIENREPNEFYDTFVDLYLLGMSKCVTYNRGGYGQWGSLISYDVSCHHNLKTSIAGIGSPCKSSISKSNDDDPTAVELNNNEPSSSSSSIVPPLFLDPMVQE